MSSLIASYTGTRSPDTAFGRTASLARISHQLSTAAADPGMSTALRSVGLLDVLSSAPWFHACLHRLATKSGEKSGLVQAHGTSSTQFLPAAGVRVDPIVELRGFPVRVSDDWARIASGGQGGKASTKPVVGPQFITLDQPTAFSLFPQPALPPSDYRRPATPEPLSGKRPASRQLAARPAVNARRDQKSCLESLHSRHPAPGAKGPAALLWIGRIGCLSGGRIRTLTFWTYP